MRRLRTQDSVALREVAINETPWREGGMGPASVSSFSKQEFVPRFLSKCVLALVVPAHGVFYAFIDIAVLYRFLLVMDIQLEG